MCKAAFGCVRENSEPADKTLCPQGVYVPVGKTGNE